MLKSIGITEQAYMIIYTDVYIGIRARSLTQVPDINYQET
jgi:hypothetical protein